MAPKEMWDYLSASTANSTSALTLVAQGAVQVRTQGVKNQIIHLADDGSETRVSYSNTPIFYAEIPMQNLTASQAGIVMDYWTSTALGNGKARSFRYDHHDGHSYTVRFDSDLNQIDKHGNLYDHTIRLKILGRAT